MLAAKKRSAGTKPADLPANRWLSRLGKHAAITGRVTVQGRALHKVSHP